MGLDGLVRPKAKFCEDCERSGVRRLHYRKPPWYIYPGVPGYPGTVTLSDNVAGLFQPTLQGKCDSAP
eukprot:3694862-Rhodomonas_salina.2